MGRCARARSNSFCHARKRMGLILRRSFGGAGRDETRRSPAVSSGTSPFAMPSISSGNSVPVPSTLGALVMIWWACHCAHSEPDHFGQRIGIAAKYQQTENTTNKRFRPRVISRCIGSVVRIPRAARAACYDWKYGPGPRPTVHSSCYGHPHPPDSTHSLLFKKI
jgi:hypothetical protein